MIQPRVLYAIVLVLASTWAFRAWAQGEAPETFPYQGIDRHYYLHRAPNRTGPVPLVLALHGLDEDVAGMRATWTMDSVADREGFDVLYPVSLTTRWSYVDTRPVLLPDGKDLVDDLGFMLALLDKLVADHITDPARIYAAGRSNGALMTWTLACQASDRIAAAAPIVSAMIERQVELCHPKRLIPVAVIAGTDDWTQSYDGAAGENFRLLSIPETLEFWRKQRACAGVRLTDIPPHVQTDPTAAVLLEWTRCRDPSPLIFYRIEGGGHYMPSFRPMTEIEERQHGGRSQTIETAEALWAFFRKTAP
jgi:polyhydroxybutyrate depolymerase